MTKTRVVLLAAGRGTRMKSRLPKLMHPLGGRPMILYSLETAEALGGQPPIIVIGHGANEIKQVIGDRAEFVEQTEQLGTGHALQQTRPLLEGQVDNILVVNADLPLLQTDTLRELTGVQEKKKPAFTMLTMKQKDSRGFGRIKRKSGKVVAIFEEAEATAKELLIEELNVGIYCFQSKWLWPALKKIKPSAKKGEYYLTDLLEIAVKNKKRVETVSLEDLDQSIGVNNREHLAEAEAALRKRINRHWMLSGVTIMDPQTTHIEAGVTIGQDTVVWPNTMLMGQTSVGEDCHIGPHTLIRSSRVGNKCQIQAAYIELAIIEDRVEIGPFAHLRTDAHLSEGVHIGNFGEVKNSLLGPGVKMGHFSYIGDATIGANVNIGAGTITANFDGKNKNPTTIEADAFIGSDTMLVAPLKIGRGARTGAGSVVTKDVPANTVVVGVPARAIRKVEETH
ncbi:MAG: bifunctional UDP-N-acetylglucosamine diphosphorylase/glucosamine-1-phosphate N-acetyltransferase GlmU [Anaerolineales bacterium]